MRGLTPQFGSPDVASLHPGYNAQITFRALKSAICAAL